MSELTGAAAEILGDFDTKEVIVRYFHPDTGAVAVEVTLSPEATLEFAFILTTASYAVIDQP